jgi:hypothetical protein
LVGGHANTFLLVIPAHAGIHGRAPLMVRATIECVGTMDPGVRRDDEEQADGHITPSAHSPAR